MKAFTPEELYQLKLEFAKANRATAADGHEGGGLTFEEFRQVMANINLNHLPLEILFDVFDVDGSKTIDYREFLLGVSKFRLRGTDALKCK